ncbi:hypothetical protein BDQ17DRAFT_1411914 [Cyathus striatus]|nr:hypothetical protein BDQ17DRAFT_1411914 [Cyathus striatus]
MALSLETIWEDIKSLLGYIGKATMMVVILVNWKQERNVSNRNEIDYLADGKCLAERWFELTLFVRLKLVNETQDHGVHNLFLEEAPQCRRDDVYYPSPRVVAVAQAAGAARHRGMLKSWIIT